MSLRPQPINDVVWSGFLSIGVRWAQEVDHLRAGHAWKMMRVRRFLLSPNIMSKRCYMYRTMCQSQMLLSISAIWMMPSMALRFFSTP